MVNRNNVFVGAPDNVTGAILTAPVSTSLPVGANEPPDAAFVKSGYISEDGLSLSPSSSFTPIRDWSGAKVRQLLTEFDATLTWSHLELNEQTLRTYLGNDNVTVTPATASTGTQLAGMFNANEKPVESRVFNIKDGPRKVRLVVPLGQVTESGEISFTRSGAITLPITLETFPDESGNHIYLYTDDGVFTA